MKLIHVTTRRPADNCAQNTEDERDEGFAKTNIDSGSQSVPLQEWERAHQHTLPTSGNPDLFPIND